MVAAGGALNPWFSIWIKPRATMRWILDTEPRRMVLPLAALGGVSQGLQAATPRILADFPIVTIVGLKVAVGAIGGVLGVYLGGFLIRLTGRWLGGSGDSVGVRSALAWSQIPTIWSILLILPLLAAFGAEAFRLDPSSMGDTPGVWLFMLPYIVVQIVVGIWGLVITLKCVGEVHGLSAWHALGALVVAFLLVVLAAVVVVGVPALFFVLR